MSGMDMLGEGEVRMHLDVGMLDRYPVDKFYHVFDLGQACRPHSSSTVHVDLVS
jgi:hypothetical protein